MLHFGRRKRSNELCVRPVPDAQNAVLPAGDDNLSIRRDGGGLEEIIRAGEGTDFVAVLAHKPYLAVARSGQRLVGVADETDGGDFLVETGDVFSLFNVSEVPDFDHVVRSGAGQRPLVPVPTDA